MPSIILLLCLTVVSTNADSYFFPKSDLYVPYPGLPPLPFPALHFLCVGREGTVFFLPWDCTGYVRCHHDSAYWTRCPFDDRSVAILKEPICVNKPKCLLRQAARWQDFCRQTDRVPHPSSSNCAAYHDCSIGQEGTERHCPYPELFNADTRRCENFRTAEAQCGSRYVPKAPCEYNENQSCGATPICLPCPERWPSCVGRNDGFHEIRKDYSWYMKCESNRTVDIPKCPDGTVYSSQCGCTVPGAVSC